jgi:outer membrane protein
LTPRVPTNDWSYQLNLRQPIYAGRRELRAYQQSKLGIEQAREALLGAENLVLFQVGVDYLAIVEAETLVAVEETNLELARRRLKQSTDFFEVGEVTRVDVLRAEAGIKAAERGLVSAQARREAAEGRLRVDLALEGDIAVSPPGEFLPPLPAEEELVALAVAASPAVEQARTELAIAELEVRKRKGAYQPVLFANGGWIRQRGGFPADEYGFLALNVEVPVFQGGETRARIREAEERERQVRLGVEDLERTVREEVRVALLDVETARTLSALAREELAAAEAEYQETFELYRAQEAAALELDTAEAALADARRRLAAAEIAATNAHLRALYLAGALKPAVGATAAKEENQAP